MVEVRAPRVDDRRSAERFRSALLPPYARRSPKVTEVLPILYLRGLSTGDFGPALSSFFGSDAGLSPSTISRLTETWQAEHAGWSRRDLSTVDYVYWWVDGVHFRIRLEEDRLCCLVIIGVRPDGTKELVAVADGYRESTESWADLLRDLKARGLGAPVLATGDGALGFWAALRDVFPKTREQACWVHKTARVLDALLAFFDFPAEHAIHLRTTNPIESTLSTVRLRTRVTKGAGSREAGLAMAFKLLDAASERWRKVNAPHLVTLVRAGARFIDGQLLERSEPRPTEPIIEEGAAA